MEWNTQKLSKAERMDAAASLTNGKLVSTEDIVPFLEAVIRPHDKVVLEGCNQKQAAFLAGALTKVSPEKINHLNMIIPSISRDEHLELFAKGIAEELNFAFAGV
ncbi:MAG: malonate decarboxylase subunit alpha, partial [Solobacterium sp.]|nr:malonate decarboxylase subunit alpha [Solobacterium sp.]